MSERERWIVYPLLFLALGAALRDKLFDQTRSKSIVCQELTVLSEDPGGRRQPRVLARIGAPEGDASPNASPVQMVLGGPLVVEGALYANTVLADNYVYRQIPFAPAVMQVIPGLSTEMLRAMQQQAEAQHGNQPAENPTPAANGQQAPPQPTAPAGDKLPPPQQQPSE